MPELCQKVFIVLHAVCEELTSRGITTQTLVYWPSSSRLLFASCCLTNRYLRIIDSFNEQSTMQVLKWNRCLITELLITPVKVENSPEISVGRFFCKINHVWRCSIPGSNCYLLILLLPMKPFIQKPTYIFFQCAKLDITSIKLNFSFH